MASLPYVHAFLCVNATGRLYGPMPTSFTAATLNRCTVSSPVPHPSTTHSTDCPSWITLGKKERERERAFSVSGYRIIGGKKKTLRSSHNSNLGLLNSSQMLLPTGPLELWHWSRGYHNDSQVKM